MLLGCLAELSYTYFEIKLYYVISIYTDSSYENRPNKYFISSLQCSSYVFQLPGMLLQDLLKSLKRITEKQRVFMIWQTFQQKGQLFLIEGKFYTLFKLTVKYNYNKTQSCSIISQTETDTKSFCCVKARGACAEKREMEILGPAILFPQK